MKVGKQSPKVIVELQIEALEGGRSWESQCCSQRGQGFRGKGRLEKKGGGVGS